MAAPSEVFVIVRPPPSKTVNALNLQVQLLTPNLSRPISRLSGEFSRTSGSPAPSESAASSYDAVAGASVGLRRSPSLRSNRSASSTGSTAAAGVGRRVIPLYNLEFHNLLQTLVTDAGTDAKVAKFLKRGIEILGLAILDPVELPSLATAAALTPSSSPPTTTSAPAPPSPVPAPAPTGGGFLGRFKRLSFKPPPLASKQEALSPTTSISPAVLPLFPDSPDAEAANPTGKARSVSSVSGNRRLGYSFVIRKWTRKDLEGSAGMEAANEVRFEWRRARRRGLSSADRQQMASANSSPDLRGTTLPPIEDQDKLPRPASPARQPSAEFLTPKTASRSRSGTLSDDQRPNVGLVHSHSRTSEGRSHSPASSIHDDECDSDPEDSDRPWTCEVISGSSSSSSQKRLLLGTLRPAPHHPRLVAHLAVPFNLSPIPLGSSFEPGKGCVHEGLSVEEMKDVLSVTGLWVVVRENLGGLANRRKGK